MPDYTPGQPMEEILASIKRIIAEDAPLPQGVHVPGEPESEEPLELGDPIETHESPVVEAFVPPPVESAAAEPVAHAESELESSPEPMAFVPRPVEPTTVAQPAPVKPAAAATASTVSAVDQEALLSAASEAASRQALAALSSVTIDPAAGPNSLEGLVRDLLRPMLSQWLDTNLPGIVERMVAREIKRLGER